MSQDTPDAVEEFLGMLKESALPPLPALPQGPFSPTELKQTQRREVDLWHHWNTNGQKPEHLEPLHNSFKPVINKYARTYVNRVEIPSAAIHAELNKHFVNAVKTFDPSKAALNTWVETNLRKVSRFVKTYQNIGKIPEQQIDRIREFDKAKDELRTKLGFEPDTKSLAEHLKWPQKRVSQLQKERRAAIPSSDPRFSQVDPAQHLSPREFEAIHLIQYDLNPQERTVYEYTFGMNGRPMLKPGEISSQAGINLTKVSRIRKKLQKELHKTLNLLEE